MAAFGIHLGASSACLAVYKDGKAEIVANAAGDRTTPAVVAFSDHDKVVGLAAKQGMIRNAKNTVCHVKRMLGLEFSHECVQIEKSTLQTQLVDIDGKPAYKVSHLEKEVTVTPEQCATDIFATMRDIAQHHGDGEVHDTVLAAPWNYTDQQKIALKSAAEKAGFNVMRIISDHAAGLLAYDEGQLDHHEQSTCLVLRIGGTSSSASCVSIDGGFYRVLSNCESNDLGGDMFTTALAEHFCKEFIRLYKTDPKESKRSWMKLLSSAEQCKHTLTKLPNAHCMIDSLHEGIDFNANIARGRMDMLCSHLLSKCQQLIDQATSDSGIDKSEINKVILCGGSTKIACVVKKIQDILPGCELKSSIPTDEVIAVGAAKEASILLSHEGTRANPSVQLKCLNEEIGILVQGHEYEKLFGPNSAVPLKGKKTVICAQESFKMVVTSGGGGKSGKILAKVILKEAGEGSEVHTHVNIDNDGTMHISCSEPTSNATANITVTTVKN